MEFIKRLLVLSILFVLLGCDNTDNKETITKPAEDQQTSILTDNTTNTEKTSQQNLLSDAEKIKKYKNKQLSIIDCTEVILDGSSTLAVTFSVPLNPKQNFANLARLMDKNSGYIDGDWELSDNGLELRHRYLEPNQTYTLNIDKMLQAINDSRLKSFYQTEITTQDRKPFVGFASNGLLLPSKSMSGLPVITLNVDKIDVNFFKIKPEYLSDFIEEYGLIKQLSTWDGNAQEMQRYVDLVYSSRFDLNPKRNAQETVLINLAPIEKLQQEGVYIAVMNRAGSYNDSNPATLFSISNIGVSVHAYDNGKLSVLTHALDDGKLLPNIQLSVLCNRYVQGSSRSNTCKTLSVKTDDKGYAEITLPKLSDYRLLTATNDQQTSFVTLDRNALNLSDFNLSGSFFYQKQLFVFGPRDLYRPQEKVYVNALLRDADGHLLSDQPIQVDVISPDGQSVKSFVWQPEKSQHGFYQTSFVIPNNAATGRWEFRFDLGDDTYRYYYFSVEEFLPERMAMDITTPSNNPILMDQNINFNIKGWYLYGAPGSGNVVEGNVYLKKIDSLADYKIGDITVGGINRQIDSVMNNLDNNGIAQVSIDNSYWKDFHSPVQVTLQASLLDSGGRPVTRYATQTLWPAEKMPAIRALFADEPYYDWSSDSYETRPTVGEGETADFEVAYLNAEGQKFATNTLKAKIIRERRDYFWVWSDNRGWENNYNENQYTVSEENLSITENGTAKVSYRPDDIGAYRIEVVDNQNNIVSSLRFWNGYEWESNTNGTNSLRPDQVKLSIDKTSYSAGDTAKVYVEAPVAGSGYISLETNDGMLWKQNIEVDEKGLYVDIPIKNWGRHDIYISAMIIRPSTDAAVQTVKRAIGLLYLPIDTTNRQLKITIEAPSKTEPEKTIVVKVKMDKQKMNKDHNVTVLLSAVDSGVLNITRFITPDPYRAFLGRKRYHVDLYDVYGKLIEGSGRAANMSFGGDSMISRGKKPLTEVNIIAQQLKTIQLNEEGEGTIELVLPDFNGELRLMAQAWDDNRFGSTQQPLIVAAPVIAELSTPRFLSGGDRAVLALEIDNLTEKHQKAQVSVSTTGLVHQDLAKSMIVSLDSKQKQVVKVPVIADYGYGQGEVIVKVKGITLDDGSDYQIKRSWKIGVRPAYTATTKNYTSAINGSESWNFSGSSITDLIPNTVDAKLIISNQPPLNIAQYVESLFAYPYGCLEQTISGLYPSLYVNQAQLAELGIKTESDEQRRAKVQLGIDRILTMQRNNGSFGLWSRENEEEYWLSVYATDFLLQAKDRGYQVNQIALDSAMTRLAEYVYDTNAFNNMRNYNDHSTNDYTQFSTKAYAMMVLTKQNKITPAIRNEINHMYQQILANDKSVMLSQLPIIQLAFSAKLAGFEKIFNDLMPRVLSIKRDNQYRWLGDYGSSIRDNALVLSLLIENKLSIDKQGEYLFELSDLLNDKRYLSTQELNALFLAGWSLEQYKKEQKFKVKINGLFNNVDKSLSRSYTVDDIAHGLTIINSENVTPLYVKFSVSGYSKKSPPPTGDNGMLTIKRTYYDLKGNLIKPDQLKVGDLVVVLLDVSARKAINDALIVDFLPAGLEIENQNLMNSSVNLMSIPELAQLLKEEDSSDVKYQEYRDDRYVAAVNISNYVASNQYRKRVAYLARAVTVGNFVIPYPFVESMYHPDWFAIGKSPDLMSIVERNATNK